MSLFFSIATAVVANVISYYICKWLNDRKRR